MLEVFIFAVFGLIVGSFLNVVILRFNTGRSTTGRSGCMSCKEQLKWYDLLPIISFFALKGKCRHCGSSISNQYWIVEFITFILFVLIYMMHESIFITAMLLIVFSTLIIIVVYDFKHTIIPNSIVFLFIFSAFIINYSIFYTDANTLINIIRGLALLIFNGVIVSLPIFSLWLISSGKWMGFGDVKLTFGFGVLIGIYDGIMAVMLGFILGAIIGVILLYIPVVIKYLSLSKLTKHFTMKSEIPFAPFLIAGLFLVVFLQVDLIKFVEFFI